MRIDTSIVQRWPEAQAHLCTRILKACSAERGGLAIPWQLGIKYLPGVELNNETASICCALLALHR